VLLLGLLKVGWYSSKIIGYSKDKAQEEYNQFMNDYK